MSFFFFDGAIHSANTIHLLSNLLPDLYYSSALTGSHHYDFLHCVITEISSGEKFGFLFLSFTLSSFTSLSAILFSSPAPQSGPIFCAIFFRRRRSKNLLNRLLFRTYLGLVNRGIIRFRELLFNRRLVVRGIINLIVDLTLIGG